MPPASDSIPPSHTVSIVVVTHNSASVLGGLLESLKRFPPHIPWDLVVVDNASTDQTRSVIAGSGIPAQLLQNNTNQGFAAAVNLGVTASTGEFSLLANPDVAWEGPIVDQLVSFLAAHLRAASVVPRLVYPDGSVQPSLRRFSTHTNIWFARGSPLAWAARPQNARHAYTVADPESPAIVEAAAATFMLVRRPAFHAVGGFDDGFFLYVEDTDLCKRWHDAGWEVWMDPAVVVQHSWQGGSGVDRKLRRYHLQGIIRYFRKHHRRARIRNLALFAALSLAEVWHRIRGR
jgi:GT2 family glycosyltransferase